MLISGWLGNWGVLGKKFIIIGMFFIAVLISYEKIFNLFMLGVGCYLVWLFLLIN